MLSPISLWHYGKATVPLATGLVPKESGAFIACNEKHGERSLYILFLEPATTTDDKFPTGTEGNWWNYGRKRYGLSLE